MRLEGGNEVGRREYGWKAGMRLEGGNEVGRQTRC